MTERQIKAIHSHHAQGHCDRVIGRKLGLAARTVCKYRRLLGLPAHGHRSLSYVRALSRRSTIRPQYIQAARLGHPDLPGPGVAAVYQFVLDCQLPVRGAVLAKCLGLHESTVHSHLRDLERLGKLVSYSQTRPGRRRLKFYCLKGEK